MKCFYVAMLISTCFTKNVLFFLSHDEFFYNLAILTNNKYY